MQSLNFIESGPQDQTPIFFLPGGGVSAWSWKPVAGLLPDRRCIIVDLPETGGSLDCGPFSIAHAAAKVLELADQINPGKPFHLVGLSLGGQVAAQILASAPQRVEKALLTGTLVRKLPGSGMAGCSGDLYMPFRNMPALVKANMQSLGIPMQYYGEFAEDTMRLTAAGFRRVTVANMTFGLPAGLEKASLPVLVLVGEKELGAMLDSARDLHQALPDSRACRVSGEAHNWPLSNPALFARVLTAFLDERPLPGELTAFL